MNPSPHTLAPRKGLGHRLKGSFPLYARILCAIKARFPDIVFLGLLIFCLLLAVGGIRSSLEKGESLLASGRGRKIDVVKVKKQMTDGTLSTRKALFFKKRAE